MLSFPCTGLVPRNYLIELSQYLTQDVKNGGGGNNGTTSGSGGNNMVNTDEVKSQPWYFGTISRNDCDRLLTEKGMDGDFMIRESETNVNKQNRFCLDFGLTRSVCRLEIIRCH